MATRIFAPRGSKYGLGETSRASEGIGHSTPLSHDELQPGDLILELKAADISPSTGLAQLSHFQCIASYNWLDRSEPTVLVPGESAFR